MARAQVFRGNPELKQTVLFDNFSGGMNTTTVDEQTATNEFRLLENIELKQQGRAQNRKGFANYKFFNERFNIFNVLNIVDVLHFEVLKDETNAFDNLDDEFLSNFSITTGAIVVTHNVNYDYLYVKNLTVYNEGNLTSVNEDTELIYSSPVFHKLKNITGLNIMNYDSRKYFMLNEIIPNSETLVEYYLDDYNKLVLKKYDKSNSYAPNPYEISNVGFNINSASPNTWVSSANTSVESIQSIVITALNKPNSILSNIPNSGNFTLLVYYTGSSNLINEVSVKFYNEGVTGEKTYLPSEVRKMGVNQNTGIMTFNVSVSITGNFGVFVEITKDIDIDNPIHVDRKFNTKEDLINNYINTGKSLYSDVSTGYIDLYSWNTSNKYKYDLKYKNLPKVTSSVSGTNYVYAYDTAYLYNEVNADTVLRLIGSAGEEYKIYNLPWVSGAISKTNMIEVNQLLKDTVTVVNYNGENYEDYIINDALVFEIEEDGKYYRYNGGNSGTEADLDEIDVETTQTVLSFVNQLTSNKSSQTEIKSAELGRTKGLIMQDRLVLYNENTIIFSEVYSSLTDSLDNVQGFTYFPNFNWISLPLDYQDNIQKIAYYRGSYIIFTRKRIYRLSGMLGSSDMTVTLINDSIGCISPDSVRGINNTLIFLSEDGLYMLKQNYYMEGLENVGKIDDLIAGVIPQGNNYESILYNEQYMLIIKDVSGKYQKTVKQYYNMMNSSRQYPYTVDKYKYSPDILIKSGVGLYAVKDKELYKYDKGYTDFMPRMTPMSDENLYSYDTLIETPHWSVGYPLHEKKFKSVFLKVDSVDRVPIMFDIYVDKGKYMGSEKFDVKINGLGEIEYILTENPLLTTFGRMELGKGVLGSSYLGNESYQVHKINPGAKGKVIKFTFKQRTSDYFALDAISLVYKLGKMRESR